MFYNYDIDQMLKENFDISDKATRKYLVSLDEDDKSAVATSLAAALYDKIVKRVDDIDFGTIPKSMGDITKVDGYQNTVQCLDIIKKLVLEYKESTEVVDIVINAVENVKARKALFMKAFALKSNLPTTTYNLIVLSIEHSVSFLISVCIEYIKNNESNTIDLALSKAAYNNAHDNLLFQQLAEFNSSCGSGELDSCFTEILKNGKPVREEVEVGPGYVIKTDEEEIDIPVRPIPIVDKTDDNSGLFSGEFDYNEPAQIEPIIPESDEADVETEDVDTDEDADTTTEDPDEVDFDFSEDEVKPAYQDPVVTNEVAVTLTGAALVAAKILGGAALALIGGKIALRAGVYIVKVLVPKIRNLSYYFIHCRVKISDDLAIQAQLLELNAYNLMYDDSSDLDAAKRKKIAEKQLKKAENLKKWSNKFAIDNKTAEKKTEQAIKDEDNKIKAEDIKDYLPEGTGDDILF